MRFLLQPSRSTAVNASRRLAPSSDKAVGPSAPAASTQNSAQASGGKAWGQQCSPDCGCVLRIETTLSESPTATSPTIASASYHAKRVMATSRSTAGGGGGLLLKPLFTQHDAQPSRPILTSCTCPTLHHLARQVVDHLPGNTLAQIRNEIDMGTVGSRSSVAFRHTVLREKVLPAIQAKESKVVASIHNLRKDLNDEGRVAEDGVHQMNSTEEVGHCYDLVEDSLLSMIYERMPSPRKDGVGESYSPTLGGPFRLYSQSDRARPVATEVQDKSSAEPSFHDAGDWQRKSPSNYFLFGSEESSRYGNASSGTTSMTGMLFDHMKESINEKLLGKEACSRESEEDTSEKQRAGPTYLQLLDMYGEEQINDKAEEQFMDDWLEYVDHIQSQSDRSTTG